MDDQRRLAPRGLGRTVVVSTRAFSYGIALGAAGLLFGSSHALTFPSVDASAADGSCTSVTCPPQGGAELREAVSYQQAQGRSCTSTPHLTDAVLFQWKDTDAVQVLSFDETLSATARGLGWVQRYCV